MTRIAGAPTAKPPPAPKPAPRVRSSPKPHYVPITPPPAARPTSTTAGNNPRGVAIVTKAPPSKTITTGNNPRGVQIRAPKYIVVKPPKAKVPHSTTSIGGRIAAIAGNPIAAIAAHEVTHIPSIVTNFATDVRDFVPTSIEGINTIAQAGAHDLLGVATGATHVGPGAVTQPQVQHSEVAALAESAWKNSLTHDVVTGNFKGALHKLVNHPLYGALEIAGGVGAVGRVLGAAGRVGLLGDHVAEAAKLARDDRPLIEGTPGLKRHGSPNLLVRAAQHAKDKIDLPGPIERRVVEHHIRKNVNDVYGIQGALASRHGEAIVEEQHAAAAGEKGAAAKRTPILKHHIPADRKVAADVASAQIMGAVSRKSALDDLDQLHDSIDQHLQDTKLTKMARKTAETNRDNIVKFRKNPNVKAVNEISDSYLARAQKLQDEQVQLGLLSKAQAETAPLHGAVAMGHVPGNDVRIVGTDAKLPSIRKAMYAEAKKDVTTAKNDLKEAERDATHLPIADRPKYLENAKQNLKDAQEHAAGLKKYKNEYLSGVVENTSMRVRGVDENGNPRYAVRKVLAPELRRRLIGEGRNPDEMGYVNMTAPVDKDEQIAQHATRGLSRGDAAYHSRTAKGVPTGNTRPGAASLLDSQLQSQRAIDKARGFDLLDRTQSIRDDSGKLVKGNKDTIQNLKEELEPTHGPLTIVPRRSASSVNRMDDFIAKGGVLDPTDKTLGVTKKERFGLMPTVATNHYLKHLKADNVGNGAFGAVNRAFRNTVLPLSPKWIAGNDIEGLIRSGLVGAGPRDAQIVGKVIKTMRARGDDQAADTVESIMNGQHYSMANRRNHEALLQGSLEHPDKQALIRNRQPIKMIADLYMHGIVEPVFTFNRKIESGFDRAVLGAHMHHQMLEFGANWVSATRHEQQWIEKLADGYSDPALVMDAGRFIQKTLGQYSRFGPTAKRLINTIAPFAPWYANALRFVYMTMPLDHPIAQSVLLAAGQTVQKEYAAQTSAQGNLNDKVFGHRFGALSTSLAVPGGGLVDLSRYMPWGAFSGGPINAITSPAGPQIQGPALAIVAGEDPFGSPLKDKNGPVTDKGQQLLVGLNEFALSLAGPLDLADRIIVNHGSTPYSGTTILNPELKPNSHHGGPGIIGGLERSTIPGYPTYLNSASSGSEPLLPGASSTVGRLPKGATVGRLASSSSTVGRLPTK